MWEKEKARTKLAFSPSQSQRSDGVTPHISNCRMPFDAGDPSYVSYGPNFSASCEGGVPDTPAIRHAIETVGRGRLGLSVDVVRSSTMARAIA